MLNPGETNMQMNMNNSSLNHQFLLTMGVPVVLSFPIAEALRRKGLTQIDSVDGYNTYHKIVPPKNDKINLIKWEDYILKVANKL